MSNLHCGSNHVPYTKGQEIGWATQKDGFLSMAEDNPYPEGTPEHKDWSLGWCDGYVNRSDRPGVL